MDLRKINSYMILLAIVVVVGLFVSTVARLVILAKGVDAGTANLAVSYTHLTLPTTPYV